MPYDSNGNFSLVPGTLVQTGDWVLPSQHNPPMLDFASGLSNAMTRDGRGAATDVQNFAGYRAKRFGNDIPVTTSGTASAYTATSGESLTDGAYDGVTVVIRPHIDNLISPTLAVDAMTARPVVRQDGSAMDPGGLKAGGTYSLTYRADEAKWYANVGVKEAGIRRSARTSDTPLTGADAGTMIDATGSWTQTIAAAATLGELWFCYFRNSGTGIITIDPAGSETIDGRGTVRLYSGESVLIKGDGTSFYTFGRSKIVKIQEFAVSSSVATADFTAGFDDDEIRSINIMGLGVTTAATTARLKMIFRVGSTWNGSGYAYAGCVFSSSGVSPFSGVMDNNYIKMSDDVVSTDNGTRFCMNILEKDAPYNAQCLFDYRSTHVNETIHGSGSIQTGTSITGARVYFDGDNIGAGHFSVYGVRR